MDPEDKQKPCHPETSWTQIRRSFSIAGGIKAVTTLELLSEKYTSFNRFCVVMSLIDPLNMSRYQGGVDATTGYQSATAAIKSFTNRIKISLSKHSLWVRDRFGLCISSLSAWLEVVLLGTRYVCMNVK